MRSTQPCSPTLLVRVGDPLAECPSSALGHLVISTHPLSPLSSCPRMLEKQGRTFWTAASARPAVPGAGRLWSPALETVGGLRGFHPHPHPHPDLFLGGSFGNETKTASSVNATTYWNHAARSGQSRQTQGRFTRRQDAVSSPLCPCSVSVTLLAAKGTSTNYGAHPSLSPVEGWEGGEDGGWGSTLGARGKDRRRVVGEGLT